MAVVNITRSWIQLVLNRNVAQRLDGSERGGGFRNALLMLNVIYLLGNTFQVCLEKTFKGFYRKLET